MRARAEGDGGGGLGEGGGGEGDGGGGEGDGGGGEGDAAKTGSRAIPASRLAIANTTRLRRITA